MSKTGSNPESPKPGRRIRSASELLKQFQREEIQVKQEISDKTDEYYLHLRESEAALKETDEPSPRTKHVVKMGKNKISRVNSKNGTARLSVPVRVDVNGNPREEDTVDIQQLKEFQNFIATRTKLTNDSQLNQSSQVNNNLGQVNDQLDN